MKPYLTHVDDVPEWHPPVPPPFDTEVKGATARNLGRAAGSRDLGAWVVDLPPGSRSSFTHAHSDEEEMVYVLAGEGVLRVVEPGGERERIPVRPGSFASFPAGTAIAHCFLNPGTDPLRLLVVGERKPGKDRVFYPEHPEFQELIRSRSAERIWERSG